MDPIRPNQVEPSDPFFHERADHAILDKIEIATDSEDCQKCLRRLRPLLMKINGVEDVTVDVENDRIVVTYDARKTHPPDLHDAILNSRYGRTAHAA
jgi:hypothetical protein